MTDKAITGTSTIDWTVEARLNTKKTIDECVDTAEKAANKGIKASLLGFIPSLINAIASYFTASTDTSTLSEKAVKVGRQSTDRCTKSTADLAKASMHKSTDVAFASTTSLTDFIWSWF